MAQQLREAMPWGEAPRFLIRDNDDKFGGCFDAVANGTAITILRTPVRVPNANAVGERFLRSVRAECLDHVLIRSEDHFGFILRRYCAYFNRRRPHQGIGQNVPDGSPVSPTAEGVVVEIFVFGGRHHEYRRAA